MSLAPARLLPGPMPSRRCRGDCRRYVLYRQAPTWGLQGPHENGVPVSRILGRYGVSRQSLPPSWSRRPIRFARGVPRDASKVALRHVSTSADERVWWDRFIMIRSARTYIPYPSRKSRRFVFSPLKSSACLLQENSSGTRRGGGESVRHRLMVSCLLECPQQSQRHPMKENIIRHWGGKSPGPRRLEYGTGSRAVIGTHATLLGGRGTLPDGRMGPFNPGLLNH